MKKILLAMGVAAAAFLASAETLSPDAALGRVKASASAPAMAPGAASMVLRSTMMTPDNSSPAIYLFSRNSAKGSSANLSISEPTTIYFIAADDVAEPLLGYIDLPEAADAVSVTDFPPQLQWWLSEYAAQIEAANRQAARVAPSVSSDAPVPVLAQRANRSTILPLCSTKWNQGEPYNNMTPTVGNVHCVTGCTATAMAQVMKYWNYPVNGQGTLSYTIGNNGEGSRPTGTLSLDCSTLNLNWDNMIDTYVSGSYNATQANAVAKLMMTAGYCAHMDYGTDASSASASTGIVNMKTYLNYNENMRELSRDNFGVLAWEDMLYEHLTTVGPVLYTGFGAVAGGHAFVCDGYYNGRFHFNWGWGGFCDGWFVTSALLPGGEGIGGNGSGDYSFRQSAFINITTPDHATISASSNIHNLRGNLIGTISTTYNGWLELSTTSTLFAINQDSQTHTFSYWGKFVQEDGTEIWKSGTGGSLDPNHGYYKVLVPMSGLSDGTYYVYPYYTLDDDSEKIPVGAPNGIVNYCKLTISNNGANYSVENFDGPELEATNVQAVSAIYLKSPFRVSYTANNNSQVELSDGLRPVLYTKNSSSAPAQRATSASDVTLIATGEYRLHNLTAGQSESKVLDTSMSTNLTSVPSKQVYLGMQALASGNITGETKVTVMAPASGTPQLANATITFDGNANAASNVNMSFSGTVQCTSGYYVGPIRVLIFPGSGGYNIDGFSSNTMYLETNQTGYYQATGTFSAAVKDTKYWIIPYWINPSTSSYEQLGNGIFVTITDIGSEIVDIKATGISLDQTSATLNEGESLQLTATITPDDTSNQTVEWSSSNTDVATVDQDGKVTAVAKGNATITVKTTDGSNLSATCSINVNKLVSSIMLNETEMTLNEGTTAQLTATVNPDAASNKNLSWSSNNEDVATVDQNGLVTAVAKGTATITAKSTDGSNVAATCSVTVVKLVSSIVLNESEMTMNEGTTAQLTVTLSDDANNKSVVWTSSNEAAATVDQNGLVTAIKEGATTVTATTADGSNLSASCAVTVIKFVTAINLSHPEISLKKGESLAITASVLPEDASIPALQWHSENEDVATVADGVVTAVNPGSTYVVVKSTDGSNVEERSKVDVSVVAGIDAASADGINVEVTNGSITVANVPVDEFVYIFHADGTVLAELQSVGQPITYQPATHGVYLVVVGSQTYKLVL